MGGRRSDLARRCSRFAQPDLRNARASERNARKNGTDVVARALRSGSVFMLTCDLSFACGDDSLFARKVSVREAISTPFEVAIVARSTDDDLALHAFVGRRASLRFTSTSGRVRLYRGVCDAMEQISGLSAERAEYAVRIVPEIALLAHRRNYRVFQHKSVPDIALEMLDDWGIEVERRLDPGAFPPLPYRVQHGETDLAFVDRILEEAGISYFFGTGEDDASLILAHMPETRGARTPSIPFIDREGMALEDMIRDVKVREEVRPGRVTLRDVDFRRSVDYEIAGRARTRISEEDRLEQYRYEPGTFAVESSGHAQTAPVVVASAAEGERGAERRLAAERFHRHSIGFETNVIDVAPGAVFTIDQHPRSDLGHDRRLLSIALELEWTQGAIPIARGRAVFADRPFSPPRKTEKRRVFGVETAVVVGPSGEEIHTDEYGRVRVQFHWDRDGANDDLSSCWIRVSQGWAGGAFGLFALPRVGQEVVVGYLDGDPDQPLVVGRLFNGPNAVPYALPEHKTRSTWRSRSSPGGEGSNELMFEDQRGEELVYVHAERNLDSVVKVDESHWVGHDRKKTISGDETVYVGKGRDTVVAESDVTRVGARHATTIEPAARPMPTGIEMVDGRLTLTSGEASITLDGPNLTLTAAADILLKAAADITLEASSTIHARADVTLKLEAGSTLIVQSAAGDVIIQGGPIVRINPEVRPNAMLRTALQPASALRSIDVPDGVDLDAEIATAEEQARFDANAPTWLSDRIRPGGEWDYERLDPRYARYANFHLGVVGAAMGIPEGALMRLAGISRRDRGNSKSEWGDPGNGLTGGTYPYGADPADQEMVMLGRAHYARTLGET